jgi:hypothetical protein
MLVDLTLDHINRMVLIDTVRTKINSVLARGDKEVKYFFTLVSNGDRHSFASNAQNSETAINSITRLDASVPNFYNDLKDLTNKFRQEFTNYSRVEYKFHLYISNSTYKQIKRNVSYLASTFEELSLKESQIIFYVINETLPPEEKELGGCLLVNWFYSATRKN